ncbi:MAG: hypothetical protein MEQ07_11615 [Aquimonas sp.]|nr:hypothetical protein [Aquimonas sp.]
MMERIEAGMAGRPSSRCPRSLLNLSAQMRLERAKRVGALPEYSHLLGLGFLQRVAADHADQPEARFVPVDSSRGFALFQIDPHGAARRQAGSP